MALVKSLYVFPTWTRTVALVAEHAALRDAIGDAPSVYACYRFAAKLRQFKPLLDACIASVLSSLHDEVPEFGEHIAIDGSDLPAYANGQRFVSKGGRLRVRFSDPDASWGHRSAIFTRKGGGFYGYKLHAAVCTTTGLPVAWETHTAKDAEVPVVPSLLDAMRANGLSPTTCAVDKGYDAAPGLRGVREPRHPPGGPASTDAVREGWQGWSAVVGARHLGLRRIGRQARSLQVPLPVR